MMAEVVALSLVLLPASVLFIGVFFQPRLIMQLTQRLFPSVLFLWPTKSKVVALTIDDSPHDAVTPEVLDVLQEHDCKATFFIIGSYLDKWPHLVDQMHKEGHELGNHTMEDTASWKLSKDELERQLLETDSRLQPYWGANSIKWFRPGHGWFTQSMMTTLRKHGYRVALGSLFPHDPFFVDQGPLIAKYLLARVYPGAVIILHDGKPSRRQLIDALKILLPELKRRGYKVVTLSSLVGEKPKAGSASNAGRPSKIQ
ncbi:polysaccharide deacetylase [Klebsormidium nitens]|uniref:Polysaccharide deacetylase n=1 Tax=Klebsormidium nitens TaxID=105231 RepID=A0A1Y1IAZ7_KLENI|nr:polysaccharide deacetylase [Klebsormidium nitens]|eukprot:GAQ86599.1 polysaccharide deacetylase [Klebsormidium nitens]